VYSHTSPEKMKTMRQAMIFLLIPGFVTGFGYGFSTWSSLRLTIQGHAFDIFLNAVYGFLMGFGAGFVLWVLFRKARFAIRRQP
jgi:hypothetical protein